MKNKKENDDSAICFWNDSHIRTKLLVAAATDCDIIDTFALLLSNRWNQEKKASHSRKKKTEKYLQCMDWHDCRRRIEYISVKYSFTIIYLLFYAHLLCAC